MKVQIELVDNDDEETIIIKCKNIDDRVQKIQQFISNQNASVLRLTFYKENEQYYFPLVDVLFFETNGDVVYAHTGTDAYKIKLRLYELEKDLPDTFLRVSKSTILNIKHIYAIERNITSSSRVQFRDSYKEVYVSRMYYKALKYRLQERSY